MQYCGNKCWNDIFKYFSIAIQIMKKDVYRIRLTPFHRIMVITLIFTQYILALFSFVLFYNYFGFPIPFIPYPSLANARTTHTHYIRNILLYLFFWAQHIIMATLKYKLAWVTSCTYFALYDRYIYNIMSGACLWIMCAYLEPSYILIFSIPMWVSLLFMAVGIFFLIAGSISLGSVMMPIPFDKIVNDDQIEIEPYDAKRHTTLVSDGIYGYIRHPLQAGVLFVLIFGYYTYTVDRLIFLGVNILMIVVGVLMEEKRLCYLEKDYPLYMEKVKARFIPFLI